MNEDKDLSYFKLKDELLQIINHQISDLRTEVITMFEDDFNKTLQDMDEEITMLKSKINIQTEIFDLKERILNIDKQNLEINKRVQKIITDFSIVNVDS